jgi:hypothetical protein
MKLKDWKFDKNRTNKDREVVIAEAETGTTEEGHDATFHKDCLIASSKGNNFKRRESAKGYDAMWAEAGKSA